MRAAACCLSCFINKHPNCTRHRRKLYKTRARPGSMILSALVLVEIGALVSVLFGAWLWWKALQGRWWAVGGLAYRWRTTTHRRI